MINLKFGRLNVKCVIIKTKFVITKVDSVIAE